MSSEGGLGAIGGFCGEWGEQTPARSLVYRPSSTPDLLARDGGPGTRGSRAVWLPLARWRDRRRRRPHGSWAGGRGRRLRPSRKLHGAPVAALAHGWADGSEWRRRPTSPADDSRAALVSKRRRCVRDAVTGRPRQPVGERLVSPAVRRRLRPASTTSCAAHCQTSSAERKRENGRPSCFKPRWAFAAMPRRAVLGLGWWCRGNLAETERRHLAADPTIA